MSKIGLPDFLIDTILDLPRNPKEKSRNIDQDKLSSVKEDFDSSGSSRNEAPTQPRSFCSIDTNGHIFGKKYLHRIALTKSALM